MSEETKRESAAELIAREGKVLRLCLTMADRGLRRCNAALEALQPKSPGRITLMETVEKSKGKLVLNEVRWRVVRWRIRRQTPDGKTEWNAQPIPLSGASRRVSGKFGFHDTQAEVREVIRAAVDLIEWRSRVVKAGRDFVNAMESHNAYGIAAASAHIDVAVAAATRGALRRAAIKAAAGQLERAKAAEAND